VPLFPSVPLVFVAVYAALFVGAAVAQPTLVWVALGVLGAAYGISWVVKGGGGR
jgi:hypothetical protein